MKKSIKFNEETLGARLIKYEKEYEREIPNNEHIIIRCDGHGFSKFTRGFDKPFDKIFSEAMELTAIDLAEEYHAVCTYVQSDEITLILKSPNVNKELKDYKKDWNHTSSGRVQKLASLTAGFSTMSFNKNFSELVTEEVNNRRNNPYGIASEYEDNILKKVNTAWFDSRVFGVPSDIEAFNCILHRMRDTEKNSKSMYSQAFCSHKELQNKNGEEQIQYCKEKTYNDWNTIEDRYKYGIIIKKEKYIKITSSDNLESYTLHNGVERKRLFSTSKKLNYSKENVEYIMKEVI